MISREGIHSGVMQGWSRLKQTGKSPSVLQQVEPQEMLHPAQLGPGRLCGNEETTDSHTEKSWDHAGYANSDRGFPTIPRNQCFHYAQYEEEELTVWVGGLCRE